MEIDELKMKLNVEYTEKLQQLELQAKMQKEELRKRESDIKDLTNEQVKFSNDNSKKVALLEQERDFLKNDVQNIKDTL